MSDPLIDPQQGLFAGLFTLAGAALTALVQAIVGRLRSRDETEREEIRAASEAEREKIRTDPDIVGHAFARLKLLEERLEAADKAEDALRARLLELEAKTSRLERAHARAEALAEARGLQLIEAGITPFSLDSDEGAP